VLHVVGNPLGHAHPAHRERCRERPAHC
jgi:hypothetical protein